MNEGTPAPVVVRIGKTIVELHDDGGSWVHGTIEGGGSFDAIPFHHADYRALVERAGCRDPDHLCHQHDVAHVLVAHWLGLPVSPSLEAAAGGKPVDPDLSAFEEAAVLAVQAFANASGVDLVELARLRHAPPVDLLPR